MIYFIHKVAVFCSNVRLWSNTDESSQDIIFELVYKILQGADFKTIKQWNNNYIKNILVFLIYNLISTNRKEVKCCFFPLIGPNKMVQRENKNILDDIFFLVVLLFFKSALWLWNFVNQVLFSFSRGWNVEYLSNF